MSQTQMIERLEAYIGGRWTPLANARPHEVINPATEEPIARIGLGDKSDVDRAVAAAKAAFPAFSRTTREERIALLQKIMGAYQQRYGELAETIAREVGAPIKFAQQAQAATGMGHLMEMLRVLERFEFEEQRGTHRIIREPIGVCGFITPWNWPVNQIMCKVLPALASGCTMVLKPSEVAPLNALILAEIFDAAGVPPGVFNLVNGDGPGVGQAIASHPDIDMVSFTGSTRAGILVAKAAADTVKRVHQELGGKSPNIILDGADLQKAVSRGLISVVMNSGQSCNAPTRMLVPQDRHEEAVAIAAATAQGVKVGDPFADGTVIGPVVSRTQFEKIQGLIEQGMKEGARLAAGGPGRPEGLNRGWYVRPTVFGDVNNQMVIAREEIFGPVLSILPYRDEAEAIAIANDTPYGLAAYVQGPEERAREVARALRAGSVHLNGAGADMAMPFGGYKQSGNGREWGEWGLHDFLEIKGALGWGG